MSDFISRLPARPSLEQLQKQAKDLLKLYHAGQVSALDRFRAVHARSAEPNRRPPALADAEFVIAREYGFADWAKLKEQVDIMRQSGPLFLSAKPPFYTIDWFDNSISVEGHQAEKDWDAVFSVINEHKLRSLIARGMSNAALHRLPKLNHVTRLHIGGSVTVTDEGVRHLARMPQLEDLELGGRDSPITDLGVAYAIGLLAELRRFQACWTPGLTDAGLAGLDRCVHLKDVNLLGTPTGDGVVQALAGKRDLHRFQSGRCVTDRGLALLEHYPVFKTWQGGQIRYGLMAADAEPNFLLIDGPFTNAGLARLAGLDGLFALTLSWHSPAFTSEGLGSLQQLTNLGFLGCQNNHCDDQAMRRIAAFPHLRMLMGQGAIAGNGGFEALSRSQTIEYFWGRECPNLTGHGFAALAAMPSLRGLAVSCKNVDDAPLSQLSRFPALREFMPMDVDDAGFRHVGACENLEALWCMYCRNMGDAATTHISGLPQLKTYYAGASEITDRSLDILAQMPSLERLELRQCAGLTDAGIQSLASLPYLREISLASLPNVTRQAIAAFPATVRVKYSE